MNKAILTTMVLVLVFLGINSVYLWKLTAELQKANARIQTLQNSVEQARSALTALGDAVQGELREPAEDLARQAKKKVRELDVERLLDKMTRKIQKATDAEAATGVSTNSAGTLPEQQPE